MRKFINIFVIPVICTIVLLSLTACGSDTVKHEIPNETLMQGFDWEVTTAPSLWTTYSAMAKELSNSGVTALWIPPSYKCSSGINSVGYDPYDYYDLGEFDQKGTVRTKYGTFDELKKAVKHLHKNNIKVIADVVLNHMFGGDESEAIEGITGLPEGESNEFPTRFNDPGRNNKYSNFKWDWHCFDAIGIGERDEEVPLLFPGKEWDDVFDVDYLCGLDIDYQNKEVRNEMEKWGEWFVNTLDLDGFRLDAVKYIDKSFLKEWLDKTRAKTKKDLWTVGEAWVEDAETLGAFVDAVDKKMNVFDFDLYNVFTMCQNDMSFNRINSYGLVNTEKSKYAVTFVNNHDTYRPSEDRPGILEGREYYYAYILTLDRGTPCVFWKDYSDMKDTLIPMMIARRDYAYGEDRVVAIDRNFYAYQREGTNTHDGLVMCISINEDKSFQVKAHPNTTYYDIMGNNQNQIKTDDSGAGEFPALKGKVSIWVPKG